MGDIDYRQSGVNIELGDEASKILYEAAKKTWANRRGKIGDIIAPFDDFSGLRLVDVSSLPEGSLMCLGFDGVGTKNEIAERMQKHETVAYDLFAMVCDDAAIRGGEPVIIGSILDVKGLETDNKSHINFVKQLAEGYVKAAEDAGVAIINGELAEVGTRVQGFGDFNYNWGAGLVWFARKDRLLTGKEVKVGDKVVALRETGFRSNGLSLARKILEKNFGKHWHEEDFQGEKMGNIVLTPSKIYSKAICALNGGFADEARAEIHGIVHVTGGGIPGKLGRVLKPSGFGAELDNLFAPNELMSYLEKIGGVDSAEAYRTWCMGQGMLVITPEPEKVIEIVKEFGIEAQACGEITEEKSITITNAKGEELVF